MVSIRHIDQKIMQQLLSCTLLTLAPPAADTGGITMETILLDLIQAKFLVENGIKELGCE